MTTEKVPTTREYFTDLVEQTYRTQHKGSLQDAYDQAVIDFVKKHGFHPGFAFLAFKKARYKAK